MSHYPPTPPLLGRWVRIYRGLTSREVSVSKILPEFPFSTLPSKQLAGVHREVSDSRIPPEFLKNLLVV
jgi:hypothetical protein